MCSYAPLLPPPQESTYTAILHHADKYKDVMLSCNQANNFLDTERKGTASRSRQCTAGNVTTTRFAYDDATDHCTRDETKLLDSD